MNNVAKIRMRASSPLDINWAEERLECDFEPSTSGITVLYGEDIRAVALYNHWTKSGCMAHIVTDGSRRWATRGVLWAFFAYPFIENSRSRITLIISVDNIPSQILALKLGFSFEGRNREAYRGRDQIVMGMMREECRWIEQGA